MKHIRYTLTACLAGLATIPAAPAEETQRIQILDPMVVTSDLWASPSDRLSSSATVLSTAGLLNSGIRHAGDIVDLAPNFTYSGGTSRPRYFQIRGIGENSQYEGETPDLSVRFLVDDFDFTGIGSLASLFDTRQVEVLRGPQAGAFGANAAGGVVRIVTAEPTPVLSGRLEATAGNDGLLEGGVAVGGPILPATPDRAMFRIAFQRHVSDGHRRNVTLNRNTNERDEMQGRARLTLNPNDLWRWDAGFLWSQVDNGFDEFALDNNGRFTFSDTPGRDEQRTFAGSLRGTRSEGDSVFTTITTFTDARSLYSYDEDWTAASYQGLSSLNRNRRSGSQEFRIDGTPDGLMSRWTLGAAFSEIREDGVYTSDNNFGFTRLDTHYASRSYSGFGQMLLEPADSTRVIIGIRSEYVDTDGSGVINTPATLTAGFNDWLFGGKVTLERDLDEHNVAFASVARGYKVGGVNFDARINPATDPLTYGTETIWNFETGLRSRFLEDRLATSITVFHLMRQDAQVRDAAGFGGDFRFFTDNGDRGRVSGLEADATWFFAETWTLSGSVGLMESRLSPFTLSNGNPGGGTRSANTPRYSFSSEIRRTPLADGWLGHIGISGQDRQFDSNNHFEARQPYTVVNTSLGYRMGNWTVTTWVRNLFDADYDKRVFFFGNEEPAFTPTRYISRADPLTFGITASAEF